MDSREVARAAIEISMTLARGRNSLSASTRRRELVPRPSITGIPELLHKVVERAVVAARREQVIDGTHHEEGAVAGRPGKLSPRSCPRPVAERGRKGGHCPAENMLPWPYSSPSGCSTSTR